MGLRDATGFESAVARLAAQQDARATPILAWAETGPHYLFALIAPRRLAPGRPKRWLAWALAPAVATYRQYGLSACLDEGISLHGAQIAAASVREIGECVVIASSFLARFPTWSGPMPSRELEDAFRLRLEAQHGWEFDHAWLAEPSRPASSTAA